MSEVSLYKPLHRICRRATPGRLRLLRTTCLGDKRILANPSRALACGGKGSFAAMQLINVSLFLLTPGRSPCTPPLTDATWPT